MALCNYAYKINNRNKNRVKSDIDNSKRLVKICGNQCKPNDGSKLDTMKKDINKKKQQIVIVDVTNDSNNSVAGDVPNDDCLATRLGKKTKTIMIMLLQIIYAIMKFTLLN